MKLFTTNVALCLLFACSLSAQQFVNPLQIPPLISSDSTNYHLNVIETLHNFSPNGSDSLNTLVPTFAFEDADNPGTTTILGPTISWQFGEDLNPQVTNMLSERTTTHWHGAHVPVYADGGPHQVIQPGATWSPAFEVKDKSATMWYHPHAMDLTYKHVQMGLSGMIYVEDADAVDPNLSFMHRIFPKSYGMDDFPLIFQTKKFMRDSGNIVIQAEQGYKSGYTYMVNGIVDPVMEVPANMIRLRILNGDGKFSFNFTVSSNDRASEQFQMIATDAGYMTQTFPKTELLMSPGERTEWLIDLRGRQGDTLYIQNDVQGIPAGIIGDSATTGGYAKNRNLIQLIVGPRSPVVPPSPIIGFPVNLVPSDQPSLSDVTNSRTKTFRQDPFLFNGQTQNLFNIDSTLMDMMVVNDVVKLDSTELWTIVNTTQVGHPWHIHDIHFWVTSIIEDGIVLDESNYPELFAGPKDNVLVRPGWTLTYIATFADYGTEIAPDSSYMYHCHILPHEDKGMMGQFVVWNGKGNPLGIENQGLSTRPMLVYPNPTSGILYLEGISADKSTVRILDLQGRVLREQVLPPLNGKVSLDVQSLSKGMVIVEWLSSEGRAIRKVVVE